MKLSRLLSVFVLFHFAAWGEAPQYKVESYPSICKALEDQENYDTAYLLQHWKILPGKNGWLATSALDFPDFENAITPFSLQELMRLKTLLAGYGTQLMLVYPPARGIVYPDELSSAVIGYQANAQQQHYLGALNTIRSQGITVADLSILLNHNDNSSLVFEKKDTHWSLDGAKAAAKVVANEIEKLGLAKLDSQATFETVYTGVKRDVGSIERAVSQICGFGITPSFLPAYSTVEKLDQQSEFSLFDDVSKDIVLLGSSFSALPKYNFDGFIREYSNNDVVSYALSGGGIIGSWVNYLKSGDFLAAPPKLIIWEVPAWREFEPRFFHAFTPLFFDACGQSNAIMHASHSSVSTQKVPNALFDAKGSDLAAKNLMIELNFSSPHVDAVQVRVWFENGASRTYNMRHQYGTANDGRFLTTLGNDHNYPNEKVVGVDIESIKYFSSGGESPTSSVSLSLCPNPMPYQG